MSVTATFTGGLPFKGTPAVHESERCALSGIISGKIKPHEWQRLRDSDFDKPENLMIFQGLRKFAYENKGGIDPNLVMDALKPVVDAIGVQYLIDTVEHYPLSAGFSAHFDRLREYANRRDLINIGTAIVQRVYSGEIASQETITAALNELRTITTADGVVRPQDWTEVMASVLDLITKARHKDGDLIGIRCGIRLIDEGIGGLRPGELTVIAARPGEGKTASAFQIAAACAKVTPTFVVSLEMDNDRLAARYLMAQASVAGMKPIAMNEMDDFALNRVKTAMDEHQDLKLYMWDVPRASARAIAHRAAVLAEEVGGLGLIVVDYLGRVKADGRQSRHDLEIGDTMDTLKEMARTLRCPVIIPVQLRRPSDGMKAQRPRLSDLRDSACIEHTADNVMFIWAPKEDEPNEVELILAKSRFGRCGKDHMTFNRDAQRFQPRSNF